MKKKIWPLTFAFAFILNTQNVYGALNEVTVKEVVVKSQGLNVRSGPGIHYKILTTVISGDKLTVIGESGGWYLVELPDKSYGMVYNSFTEAIAFKDVLDDKAAAPQGLAQGDSDEEELSGAPLLFSLSNASRAENGLSPFIWDEDLNKIATLKAEDMLTNHYFEHYSPTYGTPFKMLKQMGIVYGSASENLIANTDMNMAHEQVMASPAHRSNILSTLFTKMGVAVVESPKYGNIIVQLFIQ